MLRNHLIWGALGFISCGGMDAYIGDSLEPSLRVTSPPPGAWLEGDNVQVTGHANRVKDITLNTANITPVSGLVFGTLPVEHGLNVFDLQGVGSDGQTHWVRQSLLVGPAENPSQLIDEAMRIHINSNAMNRAIAGLTKDFDSSTLEAIVKTFNPIFNDRVEGIKVRADIQHLTFDAPIVTVNTTDGYLDFLVHIPNFFLYIDTDIHIIFEWDLDVEIGADFYFTGRVSIDPTDKGLDVDMDRTSAWIEAFYTEIDFIPNGIEERDIEPPLKQGIEDAMNSIMTDVVPGLIDDATAELDLGFDVPLGNKFTRLELGITNLDITKEGIDVDMSFQVDAPDPHVDVLGYLYAGDATADIDPHDEFTVALSDNMVNQLVYALWAGGGFNERLSTDDGSLPIIAGALFKSEAVTVDVNATLPPVVVERDGKMELQLGGLEIFVATPGGELGEYCNMRVAATMDLDIDIGDGALKLKPIVNDTYMYVYDSDWGPNPHITTQIVEEMIPMELMLGLMGDLELPMDALGDLDLDFELGIARNDSGVHTNLEIYIP